MKRFLVLVLAVLTAIPQSALAATVAGAPETKVQVMENVQHKGLYIINFTGPIRESWKQELQKQGVELGDYLADYAFVARMDSTQVDIIKQLPGVKLVSAYQGATRVGINSVAVQAQPEKVVLSLFSAQDASAVTQWVEQHGGKVTLQRGKHLEVSIDGTQVQELSQLGQVLAMDKAAKYKIFNDQAAGIVKVAGPGRNAGLTGAGQIIGVADTGIDRGVNDSTLHPDLVGRIQQIFALGRTGDASDPNGHGTHVAGSIVGTGAASQGKYQGMAPSAKLVFQSIMDSAGQLGGVAIRSLFDQAWQAGARIHSDSWGSPVNGAYDYSAKEADQYIWEKDMTVLFAAGNFGDSNGDGQPDYNTLASPGTAKNVITVGASENLRTDKGTMADNAGQIASFSSRGYTRDGRIKPDVVAPGTWILSTKSALAPSSNFWSVYNQYYGYMGGTSMATPITAGTVALLRQHFVNTIGVTPKPSLLKAALINGATNLGLSNRDQGFGRVNLENAAMLQDRQDLWFENEGVQLTTGQKKEYKLSVQSATRPLNLSLVWTDYPGSTAAAKALVNDLDITVKSPSGQIYNGNDLVAPFNSDKDRVNNVEKITIPQPEVGVYTITVEGYNVPVGPQDYSLVASADLGTSTTQPTTPTTPTPTPTTPAPTPGTTVTGVVNQSYTWGKSLTQGGMGYHYVTAAAGGTLTASLKWAGTSDLDLYLYDQNNKLLARSENGTNEEKISFKIPTAGRYLLLPYAYQGGASYQLTAQVPTDQTVVNRINLSGNLSSAGTKTKEITFDANKLGVINTMVKWDTVGADFDTYLYDPTGVQVAKASSSKLNPETISYVNTKTGKYKLVITAYSGTANFTGYITTPK